MSNKVRQNLGISHGPYIDISLAKRGPRVGKFCLVYFFDLPPPPFVLCQRMMIGRQTCSASITCGLSLGWPVVVLSLR